MIHNPRHVICFYLLVGPAPPKTINAEWRAASAEKRKLYRQNPITDLWSCLILDWIWPLRINTKCLYIECYFEWHRHRCFYLGKSKVKSLISHCPSPSQCNPRSLEWLACIHRSLFSDCQWSVGWKKNMINWAILVNLAQYLIILPSITWWQDLGCGSTLSDQIQFTDREHLLVYSESPYFLY